MDIDLSLLGVDAENGSLTSLFPRLSHITFSTSCYHKFLLLLTCEIIRIDAKKLAIDHGLRACNDFFINASVNDIFVNVCAEKELLNDCRVYFVVIIIIIVVSFSVLIKKSLIVSLTDTHFAALFNEYFFIIIFSHCDVI